ncbi:MAG: nickel-type superoxide dismutase maturation protease [Alkalispirochaeta sp.]
MRIPVTTVALTVLGFGLFIIASVRLYGVEGTSMEPAIAPGQVVVVNRLAFRFHTPTPGDVVVARHPIDPNRVVVKRLASGTADGRYILHGDNSGGSLDSRHYGAVSPSQILGRVVFIGPEQQR